MAERGFARIANLSTQRVNETREFDDAARLEGAEANIFVDVEDGDNAPLEGALTDTSTGAAAGIATQAAAAIDEYEVDTDLGPAGQPGVVVHYDGADWIDGVPTRAQIVAECDAGGASQALGRHAEAGKPVFFMPTDVEESNEYCGGRPVYTIRMFGSMMDGSKADVTITGIEVFFDVVVPDAWAGARAGAFDEHLRTLLADAASASEISITTVKAHPIRGYNTEPKPYKRVRTSNLQQRKKAIASVREAGMMTASDDRSSYYRKAARELGLPLSDWAVLSGYDYVPGPTDASPQCAHTFRVPASRFKPLVDTMAPKEKREAAAQTKARAPLLARDRTLVLAWDIETHSGRGTGDLPVAEHDEDACFMICLSAHWKDDPEPLRRVCIVDVASAPDPKWTTVVCGTPENVLRAFALCWGALAPDIVTGFNDSSYDWPFVVGKAQRLGILGWMFDRMTAAPRRAASTDETIMKWNYARDKGVKISAEEKFLSSYLKVPGSVPIDVRVCFKKLYPKSETQKAGSLKFYLEVSGLPGKADMPITRMWRYYESALARRQKIAGANASGGAHDIAHDIAQCSENMRHVSHYCVVDAVRCQQLLVRRNVINDYREVSSLAFVSLFDAHYYAGGMKVCNLLSAYAWRRNILVSMIPLESAESGKYPGAYVFPPEKGIVPDPERVAACDRAAARAREASAANEASGTELVDARAAVEAAFDALAADRPVTGLDFSSLYPSLIMTYNLSPEKIILDEDEALAWAARGRNLHPIDFPFNGRTVRGWSIKHDNVAENIGLYPAVLIDLFAKRAEMKVDLGVFGATKELLELVFGHAVKGSSSIAEAMYAVRDETRAEWDRTEAALAPDAPPLRLSPGSTVEEETNDLRRLNRNAREQLKEIERILALAGAAPSDADIEAAAKAEYERASFSWTRANTKQNALKVYMNTFYGEAGNSLSPFFLLQLAGGVTSAGQYNIKMVADFVRSKGFRIKYGDTDSLYLVAPSKYFAECDADYAAGRTCREDWMAAMVRITMRALNQLRDEVNARLRADNGTSYLKMAYEEVLFPVVFTGKKKYFGIPHLNEVNFRPKKLFVRGIDVVKQGQPGLAREIGYRIMWACVALDNARPVRAIVEDVLGDAVLNGAQWGFNHFVKTDAWKPDKRNIPVQRFIARMAAQHAIEVHAAAQASAAGAATRAYLYDLPEPGERFSYVIVKTGTMFDVHGRKSALGKGDRMAFAKAALALGLEVDVAYYMISYVVGLCARFINSDAAFQPSNADRLPEKKIDEMSQQAAKNALEVFIKGLSGVDAGQIRKRGYAYRRAYTRAAAATREALVARVGVTAAEVLHGSWIDYEMFGGAPYRDADDADADDAGDGEATTVYAAQDGTSRTINALWSAAESFASNISDAKSAQWCKEVGQLLGIAHDGSNFVSEVSAATSAAAGSAAAGSAAASDNLFRATAVRRRPVTNVVAEAHAASLNRIEAEIRNALVEQLPAMTGISARYEAALCDIVARERYEEHVANPELGESEESAAGAIAAGDAAAGAADRDVLLGLSEQDKATLMEFRRRWIDAVGVVLVRQQSASYAEYLRGLKNKRLGTPRVPTKAERAAAVADAAAHFKPRGVVADDDL